MIRTKIFRYLFGIFLITAVMFLLTFYPFESLLEWQSPILARCFFVLMLCFAICLIRLILGPTAADRAVAVDAKIIRQHLLYKTFNMYVCFSK